MTTHVRNRRYAVTIHAGPSRMEAKSVYHRNGLPFEVLTKWMWYFKYREALYRVAHPQHYCELHHAGYDYTPPAEEERKRLKGKIAGVKGTITEYTTKLRMAKQAWTQLWPIEENDKYKRSVEKIERLKKELEDLQQQYDKLTS